MTPLQGMPNSLALFYDLNVLGIVKISYHSCAGKHERCLYWEYTIYPHYYLPPFTIYANLLLTPIYYSPHLLFTLIYYVPPFNVYPLFSLPPFTIYPHLLVTPIYYLPPFFLALRLIGSFSAGLF